MNITTLHNSLQVHKKFSVQKKVFIHSIFYIYLKQMGLNLSTNLRCLFTIFRPCDVTGLWKSTQFLLEFTLHVLPLVHILWVSRPRLPVFQTGVGLGWSFCQWWIEKHRSEIWKNYINLIYNHSQNTWYFSTATVDCSKPQATN